MKLKTASVKRMIRKTEEDVSGFLQNILESSTEYSIIGKDLQGTILLWNEGARPRLGAVW